MYAAYWYLAATAAICGFAFFRGPVNRDCAIAVIIWFALAQLGYSRGEVEWLSTYIITGVQFLVVGYLVGKHDHHGLPLWLLVTNAARVIWNAYYGSDPEADSYTFKYVKNAIYILDLGALTVSSVWTKTPKN